MTYEQWAESFIKEFVYPGEREKARLALRAFLALLVTDGRSWGPGSSRPR